MAKDEYIRDPSTEEEFEHNARLKVEEESLRRRQIYRQGFIDGLVAYAHWKDGVQEVGTTGTSLKSAIAAVEKTWNWSPPD